MSSLAKLLAGLFVVVVVVGAVTIVGLVRSAHEDRIELADARQRLQSANQLIAAQQAAAQQIAAQQIALQRTATQPPVVQVVELQKQLAQTQQTLAAVSQERVVLRRQLATVSADKKNIENRFNQQLLQGQRDNQNTASAVAQDIQKLNSDQVTIAQLSAENAKLKAALNAANASAQTTGSTAGK
jgi:hypothetical protein